MTALILALLEKHTNSQLVSECLQACGHEVIVVETFVKAKTIIKAQTVDLILSDVHLENGGSVFDFLRWVKKREQSCEIPFVLFSTQPSPIAKYLADGVRTSARILGAAKYIEMEILDPELLREQLDELLPLEKRSCKINSNSEL